MGRPHERGLSPPRQPHTPDRCSSQVFAIHTHLSSTVHTQDQTLSTFMRRFDEKKDGPSMVAALQAIEAGIVANARPYVEHFPVLLDHLFALLCTAPDPTRDAAFRVLPALLGSVEVCRCVGSSALPNLTLLFRC